MSTPTSSSAVTRTRSSSARSRGSAVINSGSVGMPYEDAPGAYWTLDLVHRHTEYNGAEPPKAGREQAISHFDRLAVGA
jgi:hypothetical protein